MGRISRILRVKPKPRLLNNSEDQKLSLLWEETATLYLATSYSAPLQLVFDSYQDKEAALWRCDPLLEPGSWASLEGTKGRLSGPTDAPQPALDERNTNQLTAPLPFLYHIAKK